MACRDENRRRHAVEASTNWNNNHKYGREPVKGIDRARAKARPAVMAGLLALVAAAGTVGVAGTAGAASSSGKHYKLTVALTGAAVAEADVYIAKERGYFQKQGLTVTISVAGSTVATDVAAGQYDIGLIGASSTLPPTAQGHPMSIVYNPIPVSLGSTLVVKYNSPYKTLMDMSGQKVAVLGVGSANYGSAVSFSKYIVAHGGKPLVLVPATSDQAGVDEVISGQVAGTFGEADDRVPYLKAKQVRILVNGSSKLAEKITPLQLVGASYFGLKSTVKANAKAVTALVAGLRKADTWMKTASPTAIANTLVAASTLYAQTGKAALIAEIPYDKPFFSPSNGFVTKSAWNASLKAFGTWGLQTITVKTPKFSYQNMVNMSYWKAASKLIKGSS